MKKSLLKSNIFYLVLTGLLYIIIIATDFIKTDLYKWNFLRTSGALLVALVFVFLLARVIFKWCFLNRNMIWKLISCIVFAPILFCLFLFAAILSLKLFEGLPRGIKSEITLRNTTLFVGVLGPARSYDGTAVFQRAPFLGQDHFFQLTSVCSSESKDQEISFKIIDDQHIECTTKDGKIVVKLPF